MMIIATHKDFIYDNRFKDACIIDGGECKNVYSIPVYHENEYPSRYTKLHDSYAELSRLHHAYTVLKNHLGSYVGFMQYKRMFNVPEEDIPKIIDKHGAILSAPVSQFPTIGKAYGTWHNIKDIELASDIVKKAFPHFSDDVDNTLWKDDVKLHPHNTIITSRSAFNDWCFFLFRIFEKFDKEKGWNNIEDWKQSGAQLKTHGFLAERLSNIFFNRFFSNPKIIGFN